MIRAVIKNRSGDVVRGPLTFSDADDLTRFSTANKEAFSRMGQKIVELAPSPLNDEELALLGFLQKHAGQANALIKRFVIDSDMHRRASNLTPTKADIEAFRDTMKAAADRYAELSFKEFGIAP